MLLSVDLVLGTGDPRLDQQGGLLESARNLTCVMRVRVVTFGSVTAPSL